MGYFYAAAHVQVQHLGHPSDRDNTIPFAAFKTYTGPSKFSSLFVSVI